MERDFLGLSVKQEIPDEATDPAPLRSSTMQWSFPNKGSAVPHLLSFQEDHKVQTGCGSGLLAMGTDAFDSDYKPHSAPQKSIMPERQGVQYAIHRTGTKQDNLQLAPAVPASVHRSFIDTSGPSLIGPLSLGLQPLASVPFANPATAVSSNSPIVGSTDLRNGSKILGAPTQLTIFYNGSVCVYDNISPDKAQAIMLLAGNGPPTPSSAALAQNSVARPPVLDPFPVSQPYGVTPHRSSPIQVTPLSIAQPAVHSCTKNDVTALKPTGVCMSSSVIAEPLRTTKSVGSVSVKFLSSDTVPQFRKKSLARFLEKRKERVISASPYAKESADCSTPTNRSTNNASGYRPVSAMN